MDLNSMWIILGIGLASNLDNAGVGIAYGVRRIHISFWANVTIAIISIVATIVGGTIGGIASLWLSPLLAHSIGTAVLVSVGVWVIYQPFLAQRTQKKAPPPNTVTQILRTPERADVDRSQSISIAEAVLLGVALSMNALAGGFDAGITQTNLIATAIVVGALSFVLMAVCSYVGARFTAKRLGDRATILSGLLLILIGIFQLF